MLVFGTIIYMGFRENWAYRKALRDFGKATRRYYEVIENGAPMSDASRRNAYQKYDDMFDLVEQKGHAAGRYREQIIEDRRQVYSKKYRRRQFPFLGK